MLSLFAEVTCISPAAAILTVDVIATPFHESTDSQTNGAGRRLCVAERPDFKDLVGSLKKAASALREAGVPFMLGGGLASAARGGPETEHDVDLFLKPEDAEHALAALEEAGFRPEKPPEGWLYKAWDGDIFVDLIFETSAGPVEDEHFERSDEFEVYAVPMRVQSPEDLLVAKLLALDEMSLNMKAPLQIARALREQIDWADVYARTEGSPYAKAFLSLLEELEIVSKEALSATGGSDPGGQT
jgi:hypothetical protein